MGRPTGKGPRCVTPTMAPHKLRGMDCERCTRCEGLWLDLEVYLRYGEALALKFPDPPGDPVPSSSKRQCLRCGFVMQVYLATIDSIPIDGCPERHGLWFDRDELTQLSRRALGGMQHTDWLPLGRGGD